MISGVSMEVDISRKGVTRRIGHFVGYLAYRKPHFKADTAYIVGPRNQRTVTLARVAIPCK